MCLTCIMYPDFWNKGQTKASKTLRLDNMLDPWKHVLNCCVQLCGYIISSSQHDSGVRPKQMIIFSSGITVMKELTATTRAVLDQIRVGDQKYINKTDIHLIYLKPT